MLALVSEGMTNREVARALGLSDKTVKNYLSHVFEKLNLSPPRGGRRRSSPATI
ncbi:MAG: helix-turn-helix transcriptional regulator [Candidatus Methylomirabilis sp.]|nr:helix-turn-helix transcriptional regulator [Candidatus Methylomirabilis sp.]